MEELPEHVQDTPRRGGRIGGIVLIAAGLLLILIFGFDLPTRLSLGSAGLIEAPQVGALAPDFTLNDINGSPIRLSDLRGKSVLINFWATWCSPCTVEMPFLQARFEEHAGELAILAVDFDEPPELVTEFVDEYRLTFDVLLDPGAVVQDAYEVRAYPSSFFVDPEGVIRAVRIGILSEEMLDEYLAKIGIR